MISEIKNCIPDVTGYKTNTAESALKEAGVEPLSIVMTCAPSYKQIHNNTVNSQLSRVLRQKVLDDGKTVELIVSKF